MENTCVPNECGLQGCGVTRSLCSAIKDLGISPVSGSCASCIVWTEAEGAASKLNKEAVDNG
jgi:hypothetical protein